LVATLALLFNPGATYPANYYERVNFYGDTVLLDDAVDSDAYAEITLIIFSAFDSSS